MADFFQFLPHLLAAEGGYVNRPDDPGGETNRGITYRLFAGCADTILGIPGTSENLKALTEGQAGEIYKKMFWDAMKGDEFESQKLANQVCDWYVNAGNRAIKTLQRMVGAPDDGVVGPLTVGIVNATNQEWLHSAYVAERIGYYKELGNSMPQFLQGWLNRVDRLEAA